MSFLFRRPLPFSYNIRRLFSSLNSPSTSVEGDFRKTNVFPPSEFIKEFVKTPWQRDHLACLISELQMFSEIYGSSKEFSLQTWKTFFALSDVSERCNFLREYHRDEAKEEEEKEDTVEQRADTRLLSEINEAKLRNGEMVYARGFHSLFDLSGQELKRQMDAMYGIRLMGQDRVNESLPRLLIDCRFLTQFSSRTKPIFTRQIQRICDENWSSRRPFHMNILNYRPDQELAELVRRHWSFLFGPPSSRHPFSPDVSPRTLLDSSLDCSPADMLYISENAPRFLPDVAPEVKAVVLCAGSDFFPNTSSKMAAVCDNILTYRIPIQKHMSLHHTRRKQPMDALVRMLRGYFSGEDWDDNINRNAQRDMQTPSEQEKKQFQIFSKMVHDLETVRKKKEEEIRRRQQSSQDKREHRRRKHIKVWSHEISIEVVDC